MNKEDKESAILKLIDLSNGAIDPSEQQIRNLLSGDREGPYHFVNLLAFREVAEYPRDHELAGQQISGAEAYDKYGMVALEHVRKRGGRLITLNDVKTQVIGSSRHWHRVATMEYRNINTFIDMLMDSDYQTALVHREAGLESTEVFVTRPLIAAPIG